MQTNQITAQVLGLQLSALREGAGLTQAALAKRMDKASAARISRIESGEAELGPDEVEPYLAAIGTKAAEEFRRFLSYDWHHLPRPLFSHPDRAVLWEAERTLQELSRLKADPELKNSFIKRIELIENDLRSAAQYLLSLDHTVAFVGIRGVGKSTAICVLSDLQLPEADRRSLSKRMVLEAGGGGTTLCEVRIKEGPGYGVVVEPKTLEEVQSDVRDYCEQLLGFGDSSQTATSPTPGEAVALPSELARAIRNMAGLRIDAARELAASHSNLQELLTQVLSRMELPRRTRRTLWYSREEAEQPLEWLQKIFLQINNGRHPDFPLPQKIEVIVPKLALGGKDQLSLCLVDTRGINDTAGRADLEFYLDDTRAVIVLCSGFREAPDLGVQEFLSRAKEAGHPEATIQARGMLLVLAQGREATDVKDDDGIEAADEQEGYAMKGHDVREQLRGLGVANLQVQFFNAHNASSESTDEIRSAITGAVLAQRETQRTRIQDLSESVARMLQHLEDEQTLEVFREAAGVLKACLEKNRSIVAPRTRVDVEDALMDVMERAHPRTIWATLRRRGQWPNLDYYYQIGFGARRLAAAELTPRLADIRSQVETLLIGDEFEPAHDFLRQLLHRAESAVQDLLQGVQIYGRSIFEPPLGEDQEYWAVCKARYGGGPGFRRDVMDRSETWFEEPDHRAYEAQVRATIAAGWGQIVQELSELVARVAAVEEPSQSLEA